MSRPDAPILRRLDLELRPDPGRTVLRPFSPGGPSGGDGRTARIAKRVLAFPPSSLEQQMRRLWDSLEPGGHGAQAALLRRADAILEATGVASGLDGERLLLLGAYFSAEYAFEAAALFNPSVVAWPPGPAAGGDTPFLLSLRGIGEGHLSSVTFRTGAWRASGEVAVDAPAPHGRAPVIGPVRGWGDGDTVQLDCAGSAEPSETVLFPILDSQSGGLEDLRLTRFDAPGHPTTFVGTYTAVGADGIRQELLQTDDFRSFKMHPVGGALAGCKGMALFPRTVGGRHLALSRQDGESLWLASSDDLFTWTVGERVLAPVHPWESVQVGNCGSPLEIDEGWLVFTHGVGVVRNYCMGAALLDRDDPTRVLGRTADPLLEPGGDEREGYVPNVVYSCGALLRGREVLLPYGLADEFTRFAVVDVDRLLAALS